MVSNPEIGWPVVLDCMISVELLIAALRSSKRKWATPWPWTTQAAGIRVLAVRDVLVQRLSQNEPGQLGKISRKMAEAGVNIEVLYSDHDHQLILVVDDIVKGRVVSEAWIRERQCTR